NVIAMNGAVAARATSLKLQKLLNQAVAEGPISAPRASELPVAPRREPAAVVSMVSRQAVASAPRGERPRPEPIPLRQPEPAIAVDPEPVIAIEPEAIAEPVLVAEAKILAELEIVAEPARVAEPDIEPVVVAEPEPVVEPIVAAAEPGPVIALALEPAALKAEPISLRSLPELSLRPS